MIKESKNILKRKGIIKMAELSNLEKFQVAVEVAREFYYDFFYVQDCWEMGFICPCENEQTPEQEENDEYCEGYWFIDLHTYVPFKSWDAEGCQAIAGAFTKSSYFEDCTCMEEYDDVDYEWDDNLEEEENLKLSEEFYDKMYKEGLEHDGQAKLQEKVDKLLAETIKKAEKTKDKLGYYPIKLPGDKKGIPESEVTFEYEKE